MAGRMYLGNQMVSPVIMQGNGGGAFNVDVNDWLGTVNEQGVLVKDTKDMNLVFDGVKSIQYYRGFSIFRYDTTIKSVSFPDLESITGLLEQDFYGCGITAIDFPKLKTISSMNALSGSFWGNPLTNINMPELETVNGNLAFANTFRNITAESVSFPKLKSVIGQQVMAGMFNSCPNLKRAYFPLLETINSNGSTNFAFAYCGLLEYVDLTSLSTVGDGGLAQFFMECPSLKTVAFPSLVEIGPFGMASCFFDSGIETLTFPELVKINSKSSLSSAFSGCSLLETLYFQKLTTIENTTGYTNCFENMLSGCSGVTVHFPVGLDATIGNWSDVLAGFGGTNTTILYDL